MKFTFPTQHDKDKLKNVQYEKMISLRVKII